MRGTVAECRISSSAATSTLSTCRPHGLTSFDHRSTYPVDQRLFPDTECPFCSAYHSRAASAIAAAEAVLTLVDSHPAGGQLENGLERLLEPEPFHDYLPLLPFTPSAPLYVLASRLSSFPARARPLTVTIRSSTVLALPFSHRVISRPATLPR